MILFLFAQRGKKATGEGPSTFSRRTPSAFPFGEQVGLSKEVHVNAGIDFDFGAAEFWKQHLIADFDATGNDFAFFVDCAGTDGHHSRIVDLTDKTVT